MEQTQKIISLEQMATQLKEKHNLSHLLVTSWEKNGRLAYNYHHITSTVPESAAYLYLKSVIDTPYILWQRISLEDTRFANTIHKAPMIAIELAVDNLEAFRVSLQRFLKKTPSESYGYKRAAKEMYISAESPISYSTFPEYRKVRNRWYADTIKIEHLQEEHKHLQKIYAECFSNNPFRKFWLASVGRNNDLKNL